MLTCPKQEYKKQEYKQGTIYFYGGIPQQQTQDSRLDVAWETQQQKAVIP